MKEVLVQVVYKATYVLSLSTLMSEGFPFSSLSQKKLHVSDVFSCLGQVDSHQILSLIVSKENSKILTQYNSPLPTSSLQKSTKCDITSAHPPSYILYPNETRSIICLFAHLPSSNLEGLVLARLKWNYVYQMEFEEFHYEDALIMSIIGVVACNEGIVSPNQVLKL